jgi:hypothetical protein
LTKADRARSEVALQVAEPQKYLNDLAEDLEDEDVIEKEIIIEEM